jgi:putative spermidine/putrescine transport system ATP-binding protein
VLLLDEPLAALDPQRRKQMRVELKALQRRVGITFLLVTHDQGEALSMADQVAVFNNGGIVQQGTPQDIYRRPKTRFVADFVGSSNVIAPDLMALLGGEKRWASLRPEAIRLTGDGVEAKVENASFLGAATRLSVDLKGSRLHVMLPAGTPVPDVGAGIHLAWQPADIHYMDDAA